jgi:hypothetical protein
MSDPPTPILSYQRHQTAIDFEAQILAANGLRVLGILLALLGLGCGVTSPYVFVDPVSGNFPTLEGILFIIIFLFLESTGLCYWICSRKIRRGSRNAALIALIVASVHLGIMLIMLVLSTLALFATELVAIMPAGFALLFALGLLDLIRHLRHFIRSCDALRSAQ